MKTNKIFKAYSDDGHGWMAVKIADLCELGIENQISVYSYQKGESVYLEEDCDLITFVKAFELKFNTKIQMKFVRINGRSVIRSYQNYKVGVK